MTPFEKFLDLKQLQKMVTDIEVKVLSDRTKFILLAAVEKISTEDRQILLQWIENVEAVRNDESLDRNAKEGKIHDLETSRVVSEFLNRIAHTIFDRFAPQKKGIKKGILETGIANLEAFAAGLKPELAAVGYFALKKLLPAYLLSDQGGIFLNTLRSMLRSDEDASKSH